MLERLDALLWRLFWRRWVCPYCINRLCIGNHGPCYTCKRGDNFELDKES